MRGGLPRLGRARGHVAQTQRALACAFPSDGVTASIEIADSIDIYVLQITRQGNSAQGPVLSVRTSGNNIVRLEPNARTLTPAQRSYGWPRLMASQ